MKKYLLPAIGATIGAAAGVLVWEKSPEIIKAGVFVLSLALVGWFVFKKNAADAVKKIVE